MAWTEERVQLLTELWNAGHPAVEIAEKLDVSRNAVIGKLYRLELSKRRKPEAGANKAAEKRTTGRTGSRKTKTSAREKYDTHANAEAATSESEPVNDGLRETGGAKKRRRDTAVAEAQPCAAELQSDSIDVRVEVADPAAKVRDAEKVALKLSLLELTEKTCKWPIGDPSTEEFWFCGLPSALGKPYCEAHIGLAFQPLASRRDRRASR